MGDDIRSRNQSGGITAHTIYIAGASSKPPSSWWSLKKVGLSLGAAASLVAVLGYFGLKPGRVMNKTIVTSHDQRGGITAGTVNIGALDRQLTKEQYETLIKGLKSAPGRIEFSYMNDPEAANFMNQIGSAFMQAGWKQEGGIGNPMGVTFWGVILQTSQVEDLVAPIANALTRAKIPFEVRAEGGRVVPGIIIGSKPRSY